MKINDTRTMYYLLFKYLGISISRIPRLPALVKFIIAKININPWFESLFEIWGRSKCNRPI